jgi:transcriptional regulator with GAF, ATPase, and Fis domain
MTSSRPDPHKEVVCVDAKNPDAEDAALDRLSWHNWLLIAGVMILTTLGLVTGLLPPLRDRVETLWPWEQTETILMVGLSLMVFLFTAHLTRQQFQVVNLRRKLRASRQESSERMQRHCNHLYALLTVSRAVSTETNRQAIFDIITRACVDTFDCRQVSLMLVDRATGDLELRSVTGEESSAKLVGMRTHVGEGIAGWVAQHREPLLLGPTVDTSQYVGFKPKDYSINASMVVPIEVRGELVGVLNVTNPNNGKQYGADDLQAVQVFAEHAGITCRHAEQAEWMRQTIRRLDDALQSQQDPSSRAA